MALFPNELLPLLADQGAPVIHLSLPYLKGQGLCAGAGACALEGHLRGALRSLKPF